MTHSLLSCPDQHQRLVKLAQDTLVKNFSSDGFSIPANGLYPGQWLWDSGFIALGFMTFDEERAWKEIETLLSCQWADGMMPHINFLADASCYTVGPKIWQCHAPSGAPTSGITQPPVLPSMLLRMYGLSQNKEKAKAFLKKYIDKVIKNIRWYTTVRDPENLGLTVTYHPWETGMDNSPAWDKAMDSMPKNYLEDYTRIDTNYGDVEHRPQDKDYDGFMNLVFQGRHLGYDQDKLYQKSEFKIYDVCTNAILYRAISDLILLCETFDHDADLSDLALYKNKMVEAFNTKLWSEKHRTYLNYNLISNHQIDQSTSAGFLALYAGFDLGDKKEKLLESLEQYIAQTDYGLPSIAPSDAVHEPLRYWRGPIWVNINWLVYEGLKDHGMDDLAQEIQNSTFKSIQKSGYCEYYNPQNGEGIGAKNFGWSAALSLYWVLSA